MASAQLEIISPAGDVQFVPLDPERGLVNLGRHPENDVVLDAPGIAPFHALLDFRQHPFQFIALTPAAGFNRELSHWDQLELAGFTVIVLEDAGAPAAAAAPRPAVIPVSVPAARPANGHGSRGTQAAPAPGVSAAAGGPAAAGAAPALARALAATVGPDGVDRFYRQIERLPPDHADDFILVEFTPGANAVDTENQALDFAVDVRQSATCQLTIINGGDIVATFGVEVIGMDSGWVTVQPAEVNLNEGERAQVQVTFNVPRLPTSLAGAYFFSLAVTSPNYPGRMTCLGGALLVKPYYEFTVGELSPKQQVISWTRRAGGVTVPIVNRGNGEAPFRVEAEDDERACHFEIHAPGEAVGQIRQAEVRVPANSTLEVPIRISPNRRRLIGLNRHTYAYTATITPLAGGGTPRSLLGQAQGAPLIGPWTIGLAVVTLLVAIVAIFWPRIDGFYAEYDNAEYQAGGAVVRIKPGDSVRLWWSASPLVDLRIDPDPGKVDGPNGNALVKPDQATTRYTLTARNFLSFLVPNLYAQSGDVTVVLTQTQPSIVFVPQGPFLSQSDNTATLLRGQSVTLNWQVADADELVLQTNGVPESLVPGAGSRQVTPDRETTYVLVARNRFTGQDGVAAQVVLKVVDATPTPTATPSPIPAPEINRFDVLPQEIFVGDKVQLIWDVANVKQVTIRGLDGEWAPSGNVEAFPRENITYILTADNGSGQIQQMQRPVVVKPLPTGTPSPTPIPSVTPSPTPAAPKVDFFQAAPTEVTQGSSVRLSWSVSGDVTAIEIKAVGGTEQYFPTDKQGAQTTQPLSVFTQYVLTARNGTAASAPVQVNITIKPPPPAITVSAVVETTNQTLTDSNPAGDVFGYEPPVGQAVRLIWTNAAGPSTVKVSFNGQEFSPSGSTLITITRQSLISMPIVALSSNPPPLDRTAYTVEFRPVLAVPPAPTNLTLQTSIPVTDVTVTPPITLTWNYPPGNLVDITGFRLFRAPAGGSFQAISPDLPTSPLNWVDNGPGPLCGVSYYVVALYTDLVGLTQQTPTSSNSWQNPSCP